MPDQRIVIGSRGSKLALWQANYVKVQLYKFFPELHIDISIIKTKGDIIIDTPLARIGDKGLFTREIELALLNGTIDLAVHSMKDLPTSLPDGLIIGAVLEREDPRDAFVSYKYKHFSDLPEGGVIATSSLRRRANILYHRPDIQLIDIRGNVDTRLKKLKENDYDGMILAAAGLLRLGFEDNIREIIEPEKMLPAVSQGALGIEIKQGNQKISSLIEPFHNEKTAAAITAERSFLRKLEGGCQVPIGALAVVKGDSLNLQGFVSDLYGKRYFRGKISNPVKEAEQTGIQLATVLANQGAKQILEEIYREQRG